MKLLSLQLFTNLVILSAFAQAVTFNSDLINVNEFLAKNVNITQYGDYFSWEPALNMTNYANWMGNNIDSLGEKTLK
jgi:hypothetical protein